MGGHSLGSCRRMQRATARGVMHKLSTDIVNITIIITIDADYHRQDHLDADDHRQEHLDADDPEVKPT